MGFSKQKNLEVIEEELCGRYYKKPKNLDSLEDFAKDMFTSGVVILHVYYPVNTMLRRLVDQGLAFTWVDSLYAGALSYVRQELEAAVKKEPLQLCHVIKDLVFRRFYE